MDRESGRCRMTHPLDLANSLDHDHVEKAELRRTEPEITCCCGLTFLDSERAQHVCRKLEPLKESPLEVVTDAAMQMPVKRRKR